MKTILLPALLGAASTLAFVTGASAASFDLTPVINEAIVDIAIPVLVALASAAAAVCKAELKRAKFLDQDAGSKMADRVNDLLDKAIAFGAKQAEQWVGEQDFHENVDGWIASIAVDYAAKHAPDLMKAAGAMAGKQVTVLLNEKVVARLDAHPAVVGVKAAAGPAPVAKAA